MSAMTCIGCGCGFGRPCAAGCHWIRFNPKIGLGVCSQCTPYVAAWDGADGFGPIKFDLVAHLHRQREFMRRTFGVEARPAAMLPVIRKRLDEISGNPGDLSGWVQVVVLALDGAWRAGHAPAKIALAIAALQIEMELAKEPTIEFRLEIDLELPGHVREVP